MGICVYLFIVFHFFALHVIQTLWIHNLIQLWKVYMFNAFAGVHISDEQL